jgi:hypothetical protein
LSRLSTDVIACFQHDISTLARQANQQYSDVIFNPFSDVTFSGIKDPILRPWRHQMLVTMSDKELSRINVIQSVVDKRMRRRDASSACSDRTSDTAVNEPFS